MLSVVCKYVSLLRNLSKKKWFFAFFIKKISMKWDVLQSLHISHKKVCRKLDFGSNFELFESRLNQHCILMTKNFFWNRTTFTCQNKFQHRLNLSAAQNMSRNQIKTTRCSNMSINVQKSFWNKSWLRLQLRTF